ncbi:Glycosyl transferase family 2 [Ruegeria intermedia]|uniref:Glycosyl transferase family 2 n=1 Tax=Ruegeria intermedia TaxID=996115 RepID=A0A1M5BPQ9_9RHOB|nr:glycosyltransferase family 2 protein [Ruegeria intermedia]SHF44237.1 Glycosyl transferase family 2 [Ruegeria intermedia]
MASAIPAAKAAQISFFESKAKLCTEIGRLCARSAQGYIRNIAWLDAEDVAQELVLRLLKKKRLKRSRKGWCLVNRRNQPVGPLAAQIKVATLDIIKRFARPSTHLISERDNGLYDAINRGISRASGDVIGLMHSDDYFAHPDVLKRVAKAFEDPEVHGVYGDLDYVSASNTGRLIRKWRSGSYDPDLLRRGWMPPHPTLYLRRQVFEKWGLYDPGFQIAADYDAMLRYLWRGKIRLAYVPEVLVKMRVGGESNRSIGRIIRKSREDYRAIRRNEVGGIATLLQKNTSKLSQFIIREKRP